MRGFYCIAFIEYMLTGKTLLDYTNLFSPKNYEKNDNIIYIFSTNTSCLEFRFKKIDETKNDLLDEINHNDLMSEKYKNTYKYLNYVHFLILASIITDCVSISSFAFLVCVPVGIMSSAVGLKIRANTPQESKSISQL